jgi:hypothetical protein
MTDCPPEVRLTYGTRLRGRAAAAAVLGVIFATSAFGDPIPFATSESGKYLLIGNGPINGPNPSQGTVDSNQQPGVGQAVNVGSNFELGANKAPVPSISDFLNGGGGGGGPGLRGNVPDIPLNAKVVATGVDFSGNIAIVDPSGTFNLQNTGVYADPKIGIRCKQSVAG